MGSLRYILFETLIGEIAVVWRSSDEILKQVILPDIETGRYNYAKNNYSGLLYESDQSDYIQDVIEAIKDIILGADVKFSLDQMDFTELTDFQRLVLEKQFEIPHAKVTTYKDLAKLIGHDKSARPVANALAANPFPLIIPCHRTLRSDWKIGGYCGTNDGRFKKLILENEGVEFQNNVAKRKYHYPKQ